MATHYDVLGVAGDAETAEIKRAYYDRARLYHPDAHVESSAAVRDEAERAMQALNEAWSVLGNTTRRRRYDRRLEERNGDEAANGTARGRRGARPATPRPRLQLGSGFQYWMGSAGGFQRTSDGGLRLNLKVTGSSLDPLRVLAPDGLATLHAEGTPVGDRDLHALQGMRSLSYLDLSGTRVTDAGMVHLLGCERLETLMLWNTSVTDAGLALIGRLASLRQLGLGNTAVSDVGLGHLGGLQRLRVIQLWGTDVAGPGLSHLHDLPELSMVMLPWRVRGRHRRRLRAARPEMTIVA